jgi:magnesium-transporting ATPase (P-type)
MVKTGAGDSLRAPVVTLHGKQAATVLEAGRAEDLLLCAAVDLAGSEGLKKETGEGGRGNEDTLYLLDQVAAHGNILQGSGPSSACLDSHCVDLLVGAVSNDSEREEWSQVSPSSPSPRARATVDGGNGGGGFRDSGGDGKRETVERAAVLRRFAFTSEALRSSVVVAFERVIGIYVYVKGAPEVLVGLCNPATLPPNVMQEVSHHTRNGRRVLACAYRTCGAAGATWALEADRGDVESNLMWAGLLVMENTLKPDSKDAVEELVAAGLHCAMVTGDHSLTAISVARRCGILLPSRPVLLGKLVGEDGDEGARGRVEHGHNGDLSEIERVVFTKVLPLKDDLGDAKDEAGGGRGAEIEGTSKELSAREALKLMVGERAAGVSASPDGEEFEVAITGAALDVLLRLSDGITSMKRMGNQDESVNDDRERAKWWCKTSDVPSAKKRRAWGPPGLSRNPREISKHSGCVHGLPTNSPPLSPANKPAVSLPPVPLSIIELCAGSHTTSESEIACQFIRAARVFARCSPLHKQTLVTSLALNLPATVAFCGDGANDCGALKAAHVGLSLSDAESSIAAPFTSSTKSVHAMVDLIREGRAALVSSVAAFKFMALYSLTQLISVLRLYEVNATLTDGMFLWVDLFLVLPFVVTMAQTAAASRLTRLRPQGRLVSPSVLASVIGHLLLVIFYQVLTAQAVNRMRGFECDPLCRPFSHNASATLVGNTTIMQSQNTTLPDSRADATLAQDAIQSEYSTGVCWDGTGPIAPCCLKQPLGCPTHAVHPSPKVNCISVEATAAFLISQFQYLAAIISFSSGPPYRQPAYTNIYLDINLTIAILASLAITIGVQAGGLLVDEMRLVAFPDQDFPGRLLLLAVFAIIAACALESGTTYFLHTLPARFIPCCTKSGPHRLSEFQERNRHDRKNGN